MLRRLNEALEELIAAITGRALVAHVASIERGFLRRALPPPASSSATR